MKTKFNGILTLLLVFTVHFAFAQKTVSGTVSDETGSLPAVNVLVQGTDNGTETDFDGKFSLTANQGDVLVFSYVGYEDFMQTVGIANNYDIVMTGGVALEEVVITTAFGMKRQKKALGYAAVKVSSKELTEVSASNPLESLSGKLAGVDISAPAQPGASTKVVFRGMSSITGSNSPLYVIDGSPIQDNSSSGTGSTSSYDAGSGLNDLDPNIIESINFLKGAAATALYGSRAGNGAIIITTKKGRNKLKVDVSSSFDFLDVARVTHTQDQFGTGWDGKSYSFVTGEGSMAASNENGSWGPAFNGEVRPWSRIVDNQQLLKPYDALTGNIRDFYEQGTSAMNSIRLSGGSEKSDFMVSFSRADVDGIIPYDQDVFKKNNFGLNAGLKLNKLKIRVSGNYTNKDQAAVPTGQGNDAGFGKSLTQELLQMPNDVSIVDMEDRNLIFNTASYFYTPYAANPYTTLESNHVDINKNRFYGNVNFTYTFNDNFSANYQLGTDIDNEAVKRHGAIIDYIPGSTQYLAGANKVVGGVSEFNYSRKEFDTYLNLNYNKSINDDLTLSALLGVNFNERNYETLGSTVTDLVLPGFYELSNSAVAPTLSQGNATRRGYAGYTQAELGYKDKYFLTLTARNDRTSSLPLENNSYFYPSASLAAILLDNGDFFAKLRAGWAKIGNDTGAYKVFATSGQSTNAGYFGQLTYPFGGVNGYEIYGRIENQSLKPEMTNEIEFGVEARAFKDKIGLDLTVYKRDISDLIVDMPVAGSTGYSTITGNFVDMTNKGIELALNVKPLVINDFSWKIDYTFTKNLNEVTRVDSESGKIVIYSAYGINFYAEEGKPIGSFYAPAPDTTDDGQIIADASTGYYTYSGEEQYVGSAERDYIMGLKNTFKYKNFTLGAALDYKKGGSMYSYSKRLSYFVGNAIETTYNDRQPWIIPNSVVEVDDPENPGSTIYVENTTPVAHDKVTAFYNASSNAAIEQQQVIDKTFFRLRSAALSYRFPSKWIEKAKLSSLSVSLYGKNLFLWTPSDNSYVDPETTTYGSGIRSEFGEFATNPSQRSYGAGIKLSF